MANALYYVFVDFDGIDLFDAEFFRMTPAEAPDVVYDLSAKTWLQMAAGLATGDEAMLLGKLRIRGDVELGRRFNDFFAPPGNPPVRAASQPQPQRNPSPFAFGSRLMGRVLRRARAA